MEKLIKLYMDFLNESEDKNLSMEEFSEMRLKGASKIAEAAKEKGGVAMLTYHHFVVKLPYYKKAAAGKFKESETRKDLEEKMDLLNKGLAGDIKISQTDFQKLVGLIEVLGELLIKNKQ
jgi:hypothetical protein